MSHLVNDEIQEQAYNEGYDAGWKDALEEVKRLIDVELNK